MRIYQADFHISQLWISVCFKINLKINLSVHPKDYEVTNHYKKGRCIGCPDFLDRYHSDSSGKILFGNKTRREEIPWHVSIHVRNIFHGCGGTLISPSKILSAAHCFGKNPEITGQLTSGFAYKYHAIVGNTKVDFQIADLACHLRWAIWLAEIAQWALGRHHYLKFLLSVNYGLRYQKDMVKFRYSRLWR